MRLFCSSGRYFRVFTQIFFLGSVCASLASTKNIFNDDGIKMPYTPPSTQTKYLQSLSPEYRVYFKARPERVEEWQDWKFGVFMHWDPSCQVTGSMSWKRMGPRPHHKSDGTLKSGIPEEEYNSQYKTFNPTEFDADRWVKMIHDAGAKYFVFTAKHHNGFCMFDTPTTEYCIRNTPFKRDICKELAEACHKYGVKLFWYYSQPDWTEPTYRYEFGSQEFKEKYLHEYLYPQLKQLVTKYGKIDGLWFDGLGLSPKTWDAPEMLKMLRTINPDLIFNHRFSNPPMRMGDFDGPENRIGRFQINRPWETCYRIGGTWGYSEKANTISEKDAIGLLVRCAGKGGNLLLNTGPSPQGTIHEEHIQRYLQMGKWLKKYGESVYATRGGPYIPGPWGCATRNKENQFVYLHILGDWNGELQLPQLNAKILEAKNLTGASCAQVALRNGKMLLKMKNFDKNKESNIDTIIRLKLNKKAMNVPVVRSIGDSLTIGGSASASSAGTLSGEKTLPSAVVATSPKTFFDGAYVRSAWRSEKGDKTPWIQVEFEKADLVAQVAIQEGNYGKPGTVEAFTIKLRSKGNWKTVYKGSTIGSTFGVVLNHPVFADAIRIEFQQFSQGHVTLNAINAYPTATLK